MKAIGAANHPRTSLALVAVFSAILVLATAGCGSAVDENGGGSTSDPLAAPAGDGEAAGSSGRSAAESGAADEGPSEETAGPELESVLGRKIVQSSTVDLELEEVSRGFQEIIRVAQTAGGFVASSSFSNVDDRQIADITIRVPNTEYQGVLADVRLLGEVTTEGSDANDVTEEYTDLQARLRTLEATEERYLELLAQAGNIDEILTVQDRLDGVRGQIEQVQGRINLLDDLADLATITIHLRPLATGSGSSGGILHPLEAAENAWDASFDALRAVATVTLVIVAFSWWLLVPLAAAAVGARWWISRRSQAA